MAGDEPGEDEGPLGRPPAPDDRLWRHPSEVSGGASTTSGGSSGPGPRGCSGFDHRKSNT